MLVRLHYRRVLLAALASLGAVSIGLQMWRLSLDDDDASAFVLVMTLFGFWVLALSLGLLMRTLVAGYALRLDEQGLHLPGWDVVPWSALRSAELARNVGWPRDGRFAKLVLDIDDACLAHRRGSYERWLWGPIAGMTSKKEITELSMYTLAIPADRLLASLRFFSGRSIAAQPRAKAR